MGEDDKRDIHITLGRKEREILFDLMERGFKSRVKAIRACILMAGEKIPPKDNE